MAGASYIYDIGTGSDCNPDGSVAPGAFTPFVSGASFPTGQHPPMTADEWREFRSLVEVEHTSHALVDNL